MIVCVPAASEAVLKVAAPSKSTARAAVSFFVPSRKTTVPVGGRGPFTSALKVTLLSTVAGLGEADKVVVDFARSITSESAVELLALKFPSPEYETTMGCVPTARDETVMEAEP